MTTLEKAKHEAVAALAAALPGIAVTPADLTRPPQKEMGDLAFACFDAAKTFKKPPAAIAKEIAAAIKPAGLIASAEAAGPYVNIRLDAQAFSAALLDEVLGTPATFGGAEPRGEKIMIEYGQPNTHKEFHVGHLRNVCLGLSVVHLCRAAGFEVIPVSYIGDVGAHVAKFLWAYKKFHAGEPPPENKGKYLGAIYAEATQKVEENDAYKEEIAAVQRALEAHDPEWTALWEKTRAWSLEQFEAIFRELGAAFDRIYFESEVEEPGKKLVAELLEKGIAKRSQGAVIVDLENEGLGAFLVLKSDGSALYSTKELALAIKKFDEFAVDRSIHVVDTRQALYFKQFFKTLERLGFTKAMTHLAYEFVTLKEGAMSSRKGNIVAYEDFRDEMVRRVAEETVKRRADWDEKRVAETAWTIAEGAMKFGMLKQDIDRPIVFDMEAALSFDGFTGPYIQYAHARLASILAKAGHPLHLPLQKGEGPALPLFEGEVEGVAAAEYAVLRLVAEFPSIVRAAADAYRPSLLAQYLFDLAQAANDFYRDVPVLAAEEPDRSRRIAIATAVKTALKNGLSHLAIRAPEEM